MSLPVPGLYFVVLRKLGFGDLNDPVSTSVSTVLGPDFALSPSNPVRNDRAVRNSHGPDILLASVSIWCHANHRP